MFYIKGLELKLAACRVSVCHDYMVNYPWACYTEKAVYAKGFSYRESIWAKTNFEWNEKTQ